MQPTRSAGASRAADAERWHFDNMAIPRHIFIDTSVLDGCSYNFESAAVQPIIDVASKTPLTLLLPEPTEREIRRHIKGRSDEVFAALRKAQHRAPFLKKWKDWPLKGKHDFWLTYSLNEIATKELDTFLALFQVVKLDTSYIDVGDVMEWHDKGTAPFGKGSKKAEFPDAFALSSLLSFAKKEDQAVAIISADGDFQNASGLHDCLFYYPTLAAYVESLLMSDEHVKKVRDILDTNVDMIAEGIREEFVSLAFYPTDDESAELDNVEVDDVDFSELNIVGMGEKEVSVAFQADVGFSIDAKLDETDWDGPAWHTERVSGQATVTGIAKLTVNGDWSDFRSLDILRLDEEEVGVEARQDRWDM
ncbi:MAG TPA: PIN domain-containing protein [Patescibacteria group bacterium]|nr:PIN domain-containing protein [Patescibacteria group bacterium]